MSKYNKVQPNGVCWDCGKAGASPVYGVNCGTDAVANLGWRCVCGRWWACAESDLRNWIARFLLRPICFAEEDVPPNYPAAKAKANEPTCGECLGTGRSFSGPPSGATAEIRVTCPLCKGTGLGGQAGVSDEDV